MIHALHCIKKVQSQAVVPIHWIVAPGRSPTIHLSEVPPDVTFSQPVKQTEPRRQQLQSMRVNVAFIDSQFDSKFLERSTPKCLHGDRLQLTLNCVAR